jgi:hypothetical protein
MDYYSYVNWQAKDKTTILIHHWSFGDCRMGLGKYKADKLGMNGVWLGPFITRIEAFSFSNLLFNELSFANCKHCRNN